MQSKIITNFQQTGICEVDVNYVVKNWRRKSVLVGFKDFQGITFEKFILSTNKAKCEISESQANEIIERLKLKPLQSLFKTSFRYLTDSQLLEMRNKLQERKDKLTLEFDWVTKELQKVKSVL